MRRRRQCHQYGWSAWMPFWHAKRHLRSFLTTGALNEPVGSYRFGNPCPVDVRLAGTAFLNNVQSSRWWWRTEVALHLRENSSGRIFWIFSDEHYRARCRSDCQASGRTHYRYAGSTFVGMVDDQEGCARTLSYGCQVRKQLSYLLVAGDVSRAHVGAERVHDNQ